MSNVSYIIKETKSMLANGKTKTCGIWPWLTGPELGPYWCMYADGSISRPQYDVIPDLQKKIIKVFLQ